MDQISAFLRSGALTWWDVTAAVVAVLAGWLLARLAARGLTPALARVPGLSPTVRAGTITAVRWFLLLLGVGVGTTFLGGDGQPFVAAAIVVAAVAVLALRGVADNFGASVILQTRAPAHVGDEIASQGWEGVVQEVNGRSVVLRTADGRTVHLPNAGVLEHPLDNRSQAGRRRDTVEIRLAGPPDAESIALVEAAVAGAAGVEESAAPSVLVVAADSARTTLHAHYWHAATTGPATRSAVISALAVALHERDGGAWAVIDGSTDARGVPLPPV